MSDKRIADIRSMAMALALNTPPHLGKPTAPPISWRQDGEIVIVVLADGRKVSASIQQINAIMFPAKSEEPLPAPKNLPTEPKKSTVPAQRSTKK